MAGAQIPGCDSERARIVVGTAGHIDHGKTALVRALTGIDTDRMPEEKARGISIDIGFAHLALPDGRRVAMVDVPGHERFIRNMLAGAAGIDVVLLVIDAREGIMPQTAEHLAIVGLLGLNRGVVALTKADLVDEAWLSYVMDDVAAALRSTCLADAPIIPASSVTGRGLPELLAALAEAAGAVQPKSAEGALRLPIDRVVQIPGIGGVATGTVWRGAIATGDTLALAPPESSVRVRSLQSHGRPCDEIQAGERAAVAFTGYRGPLVRGMTLFQPGSLAPTTLLDVQVQVLADTATSVRHRMPVHVHLATASALGRLLLLDLQQLAAGERAFAQIALDRPLFSQARDHFVLRAGTPLTTVGGGVVIDAHPARLHRRHSPAVLQALAGRVQAGIDARLMDVLQSSPHQTVEQAAVALGEAPTATAAAWRRLRQRGEFVELIEHGPEVLKTVVERWRRELVAVAKHYYSVHPHDLWLPRSALVGALAAHGATSAEVDALVAEAVAGGDFERSGDRLKLSGHSVVLHGRDAQAYEQVRAALNQAGWDPPGLDALADTLGLRPAQVRLALHVLGQEEAIITIGPELVLDAGAVAHARAIVRELCAVQGAFTLAEFRDRLGTSRRCAVALLEYFDRQHCTRRVGDRRVCSE
jgi:selenocysteine-specific elongation factor